MASSSHLDPSASAAPESESGSVPKEVRPDGTVQTASLRSEADGAEDMVELDLELGGERALARMPRRELPAGVRPQDALAVFVDFFDGQRWVVSAEKARRLAALDRMERAFRAKETVEGEVVSLVKGGYAVDVGLRAFLPASQIALRPLKTPEEALGQRFRFRVIKFQPGPAKVVLSRRPLLEKDRDHLAKQVRVGAIVEGTVREVVSNGARVDVRGLDGFLHVNDMTWGQTKDPHQFVREGQTLRLKVLRYEKKKGRLGLGLRQLQDDPWNDADQRYPAGTPVRGMVVSKTDVGCFIEFEPGLEGLIFSTGPLATPSAQRALAKADIGDELSAQVVEVQMVSRRVILRLSNADEPGA